MGFVEDGEMMVVIGEWGGGGETVAADAARGF